MKSAKYEWDLYSKKLIDAKPVEFSLSTDGTLGSDGYEIKSDECLTTISALTTRGFIYGVFHLIEACKLNGNSFISLNVKEIPQFKKRMIWSWAKFNNTYLHSPFMALPSLLSAALINDPESSPEMMRFICHMAAMRVNALTLTYDLHVGGLTTVDQHAYLPYYKELNSFSQYLMEWGIDLYLFTSATPEKVFRDTVKNTDCPFDPVVQDYWRDFIKEIVDELPELGGLHVAGSLGGYAGSILYECSCEYCFNTTPIERIHKQIELISGLLAEQNKDLVYDLTVDRPDMLYREVDVTVSLVDKLPDNVIFSIKNHFVDFEELRLPVHPVISRLPDMDDLQFSVQFQLFPEMRGKGLILSNVTKIWCNEISYLRSKNAGGIVGVIETHPDNAHPSMAEWYSWGKLAWNPDVHEPQSLLAEWTKMNYPSGVENILPDLLKESYIAASDCLYSGGLQSAVHGMLCPSPVFLKHLMNETWFRADDPAPFDVLGVDDEPIYLYTEELQQVIKNNPRLFLWTEAHKITHGLYNQLLKEKDNAVIKYNELLEIWKTVESLFNQDDYRYISLLNMLKRNVEDAKRFRDCLSIYWRYLMNRITVTEILEVKEKLTGSHAPCSINTSDQLIADFLNNLIKLLTGIPIDTLYKHMEDMPQITTPGWEEGEVHYETF